VVIGNILPQDTAMALQMKPVLLAGENGNTGQRLSQPHRSRDN
jgi:hypothetical protein